MADLFTAKEMEGVEPNEQAKRAIRHALERIRNHPEVGYYLGIGTQTFSLLTEAAATLYGEPVEKVRKHFLPRSTRDPDNDKSRVTWYRVDSGELPRDRRRVLLATHLGEVREGYIENGKWFFANGIELWSEVITWADMPEAPEGGAS